MHKILKEIVRLLPFDIEARLRTRRNTIKRNKTIIEWLNSGSPLPPPHAVKQKVIEDFKKKSNYKILVETGTYKGHMIYAQLHNFDEIYSVELDENFFEAAKIKFNRFKHVHLLQGDSEKCLGQITTKLQEPAIFWLDGHYMGNGGAKGDSDCPIWGELEAIFSGPEMNHIILIDDARSFKGGGDYPSVESLKNWIKSKNSNYQYVVEKDIIQFFVQAK